MKCFLLIFLILLGCKSIESYPRNNELDPINLKDSTSVDIEVSLDAAILVDVTLPVDLLPPIIDAEIIQDVIPVDAEGSCNPNSDTETRACEIAGQTGVQERSCTPEGRWERWSDFCRENECNPGEHFVVNCARAGDDPNSSYIEVKNCGYNHIWEDSNGECYRCGAGSELSATIDCGAGCGQRLLLCNKDEAQWTIQDCTPKVNNACLRYDLQFEDCGCLTNRVSECDETCNWGLFSDCPIPICNEGQPGARYTCPLCHGEESDRIRCNDQCEWPEIPICPEVMTDAICDPNDVSYESCGLCGRGSREVSCSDDGCALNTSPECSYPDDFCDPEDDPYFCPCEPIQPRRRCGEDCVQRECPEVCQEYTCLVTSLFQRDADPQCDDYDKVPLFLPLTDDGLSNLFLKCHTSEGGKLVLVSGIPDHCSDASPAEGQGCSNLTDRVQSCHWLECCPEGTASGSVEGYEVIAELACDQAGQVIKIEPEALKRNNLVYFIAYSETQSVDVVRGCVALGTDIGMDQLPNPPPEGH